MAVMRIRTVFNQEVFIPLRTLSGLYLGYFVVCSDPGVDNEEDDDRYQGAAGQHLQQAAGEQAYTTLPYSYKLQGLKGQSNEIFNLQFLS